MVILVFFLSWLYKTNEVVVEQKVAAVAKKTVDLFEACLSDFVDPQKVDGGEGVFD